MAERSVIEQHMGMCRHYTGIQNEVCKAGINIRSLVGGPDWGWGRRMPCTKAFEDTDKVHCDKASFPSREEAEEYESEVKKSLEELMLDLAEGRCPHCKQEVKQRQVGHCVYGTCGHRLYQGKVNPEFAAPQRIHSARPKL